MPPPKWKRTSEIDFISQSLYPEAHTNITSVLPQQDLGSTSIKRDPFYPEVSKRVKLEPRSPSPLPPMAPAIEGHGHPMPTSSASAHTVTTSTVSLISAMVDNTQYDCMSTRRPSVSRCTTTTDEEVAKKFAAGTAALSLMNTNNGDEHPPWQSNDFSEPDPSFPATFTDNAEEGYTLQNDAVTADPAGATAASSDILPSASGFSRRNSRAISSTPDTTQPQRYKWLAQTTPKPELDNVKSCTPPSLYPGPSATVHSSDLHNSSVAKKRPRTGRSDHPERFQYAGNTFSNLDDRTFHDTAESNPYLSQLTVGASRPVYKTPLEARHALKEAKKPPLPPVNYDQQIKELIDTIANFRKKYKKSKAMTEQAGIQIAGNVWDRLSNLVQYPPDFDSYTQKGQGEICEYAEKMKAWDRAIGHQVIIKKRIVYKEAIEKLQVKLDILQAEKDLNGHNIQLKRKGQDAGDDDSEYDG